MKESYIEKALKQASYRRLLVHSIKAKLRRQKTLSGLGHGQEVDGLLAHDVAPDFDSNQFFSKSVDRINGKYANSVINTSIGLLVEEIKTVEKKLTEYDLEYIPFNLNQISESDLEGQNVLSGKTVPWEKT